MTLQLGSDPAIKFYVNTQRDISFNDLELNEGEGIAAGMQWATNVQVPNTIITSILIYGWTE
ncbi:MAG: hypothetical protein V2G41_10075 [bacterium JZ-2024 1]